MKTVDYKISRENVYVGRIVKPLSFYLHNRKCNGYEVGDIEVGAWRTYRNSFFTINDELMADDLLYDSPNYPILNISNPDSYLNADPIIIKAYNIERLLEFFGFDSFLNHEDIVNICRSYFNGYFPKDNALLFGYRELFIDDGKRDNPRTFINVEEGMLPNELWDVLNQMCDNSIDDYYNGFSTKLNAFSPHALEKNVKSLVKML